METEQTILQSITHALTASTKAEIMTVKEEEGPMKCRRPVHTASKVSRPKFREPTLDWKAQDKCNELNNFKIKVRNIIMMDTYNIEETKNVPIIINCPHHEGFTFIQTPTDNEKEKCDTISGLFDVLNEKLKPQNSEKIL